VANPGNLLSLLCDPCSLQPLELDGGQLVNRSNQRRFEIVDAVPVLVDEADLGPQNLKVQKMYKWMSRGFDLADRIGNLFMRNSIVKLRRLLASRLGLKPGDRCLYTSIGTGLDLAYLAETVRLDQIELIGLDLSMEMLRQCQKKIRPNENTTMLVQANAERLPFGAGVFDVVFHVGGISLFDRPAQAVAEMVRVAKAGSLILIADETKKVIEGQYRRNPFTRSAVKDAVTDFDPRKWPPAGVVDVNYEEVWGGKGYFLSFRTPRVSRGEGEAVDHINVRG